MPRILKQLPERAALDPLFQPYILDLLQVLYMRISMHMGQELHLGTSRKLGASPASLDFLFTRTICDIAEFRAHIFPAAGTAQGHNRFQKFVRLLIFLFVDERNYFHYLIEPGIRELIQELLSEIVDGHMFEYTIPTIEPAVPGHLQLIFSHDNPS